MSKSSLPEVYVMRAFVKIREDPAAHAAMLSGNVTTSAMAQLPLLLIPAYMVPFFIMLHVTALAQGRRLARSGKTRP